MNVPSLILAYGIGRMGCHLSGDVTGNSKLNPKPELLNFLPTGCGVTTTQIMLSMQVFQ